MSASWWSRCAGRCSRARPAPRSRSTVATSASSEVAPDSAGIVIGNAATDGAPFRGWFIGHFLGAEHGAASTEAVEVKWGMHEDREERAGWAVSAEASSLSVLVHGQIRILFADGQEALLSQPGDYA